MSVAPRGLSTWWRGKAPRERRWIAVFVSVIAFALLWFGIVDPLARDLTRLDLARADMERALYVARADAAQATTLARMPAPAATDARAALDRGLTQAGLRGNLGSLEWQDRRAVVTFGSIEFPRLMSWLESMQREAGLHVQEATLSRLVGPGLVRAELVLAP